MQVFINGVLATQDAQKDLSKAVALGKVYIVNITFGDCLQIETQEI